MHALPWIHSDAIHRGSGQYHISSVVNFSINFVDNGLPVFTLQDLSIAKSLYPSSTRSL